MLGTHGMWQSRQGAAASLQINSRSGESVGDRFIKIAALREHLDSESVARVEEAKSIISQNLDRVVDVASSSVGTTPTPAEKGNPLLDG